jgi:hypothetical protein
MTQGKNRCSRVLGGLLPVQQRYLGLGLLSRLSTCPDCSFCQPLAGLASNAAKPRAWPACRWLCEWLTVLSTMVVTSGTDVTAGSNLSGVVVCMVHVGVVSVW